MFELWERHVENDQLYSSMVEIDTGGVNISQMLLKAFMVSMTKVRYYVTLRNKC